MRKGLCWAGGRIMNAGMAMSIQQDKAVAAMAAAAAAGCGLFHQQQQPWQRRASAVLSSRRYGFETAFTLKSVFGNRKSQQDWGRKFALFSKLPFDGCSREFSNGSAMFNSANADTLDEKTCVKAVDEVPASFAAQCRSQEEDDSHQRCADSEHVSKDVSRSSEGVLQLDYAAAMLPHPQKAAKGGEDAFFMEGSWMGVADGVGGWAMEGVDSGLYSREFMGHCKALAGKSQGKPDPKDILIRAAQSTKARGSSTVLVAALFEQTLYAANLGDAGFLVVRDWEVIASSKPMQHEFNFPYQVGVMGDNPNSAQTFNVSVCKGDIILLATDGLFDNLFSHDILDVLKSTVGSGSTLQAAATILVKKAQVVGADTAAISPFAKAASECFGRHAAYRGGKLDDVTAVVASVS